MDLESGTTMNSEQLIKILSSLMHLDIDAVHSYEQVIEQIDIAEVKEELSEFRRDHERHVDQLENSIRELGGVPPERKRDLKGFIIEGFTAIRSRTGTKGALKAMLTNERITNKKYSECLNNSMPENIRSLVDNNYKDEQRHLAYVEVTLLSLQKAG